MFSNAALHWLPDHEALITRVTRALRPGRAARGPGSGEPRPSVARHGRRGGEGDGHRSRIRQNVLPPEAYAAILGRLGFAEQQVRLQVYLHRLDSRDAVVEWVKGTMLTDYARRLPEDAYADFLARYRERLLPRLEDSRPYLFTFKRIHFWGLRLP